jgi:hypothetical protein
MNDKIYPADYSLDQWLELRKGWHDPKGDTEWWCRAQRSVLGPNRDTQLDHFYYPNGFDDNACTEMLEWVTHWSKK